MNMRLMALLLMAALAALLLPISRAAESARTPLDLRENPPTIVYLVRHAEKLATDPSDRDPGLSPAGQLRCAALVQTLQSVAIDAVFATEYKRTQHTVEPVAKSHDLQVNIASARDPAGLAARITGEFRGRSVLVAGHSNTVPAVIKALGIADPPTLSESDYDDLFIVTLSDSAAPSMLHLHFGRPDATEAVRTSLEQEANQLLDTLHDAAARADKESYFKCFEAEALFLGTDASERWTLDEFRAFALPYFERDSAWTYVPVSREVNVSDDLAYAWFDEQLDNAKYGRCRGTGLLRHTAGEWRIVQYHLTMPIPNDLAVETAERIRSRATDDR